MTDLSPLPISDQRQALETAAAWVQNGAVVIDTETTDLDSSARLVSLAIVDLAGNVLFNEVLNPGIPCPAEATAIHGITNERLEAARTVWEAWPEICGILSGKPVLSYNADFDIRILAQTAIALELKVPGTKSFDCIMETYAAYNGEWDDRHNHYRWLKLVDAAKDLAIPTQGMHSALGDAQLARQIVLRMAGRFEELTTGAEKYERMENGIKLLALYRRNQREAQDGMAEMLLKLKKSRKWQALFAQQEEAERFAAGLEAEIRADAEQNFERTGYHTQHPAIEVKNASSLHYDERDAIDWSIDNLRLALSLDKRFFEKHTRAVLGTNPLPFVGIEYTPKAYLKTDLSAYLPKPEPAEHVQINMDEISEIAF